MDLQEEYLEHQFSTVQPKVLFSKYDIFLNFIVLRNGGEIISPIKHHSFRPSSPDFQSQKYWNSPLFLQLL